MQRTTKTETAQIEPAGQASCAITIGMPVWKRAFDVVILLISSPVWFSLGVLVAVAVRIGSHGPILFRQERIGQGGRIFTCLKFRTMQANVSQISHHQHVKELIRTSVPMVKLDAGNDMRLIPGGAWIRASGLDEVPQIINILRGEMSVVGPRPCVPYEFAEYQPWQRQRCNAPPGLTGLWQVSGKNRTTFDQMIQLDIDYSRRMSLWLDTKVVLLTPVAIVRQVCDLWAAKRARKSGGSVQKRNAVVSSS